MSASPLVVFLWSILMLFPHLFKSLQTITFLSGYQPEVIEFSHLLTNERPTWCHLLFYFTYYVLNMFRTLIYPSSGACDCVDELQHRSSCSLFVVCWSFWCGNKTTDVVIRQHSRKLLKMDILMSETCWAHNKWNKIASDVKLFFHSSTIAKMHGPINIKFSHFFAFAEPMTYMSHLFHVRWIHNRSNIARTLA